MTPDYEGLLQVIGDLIALMFHEDFDFILKIKGIPELSLTRKRKKK